MVVDVGTTLTGRNGQYELTAYLGDGLTARVFKAKAAWLEDLVAVKVLKPGLPAAIVERFQTEYKNVTEVNRWITPTSSAIETSDDDPDRPASPPKFYEFAEQQSDQPGFLVLELMTGRQVEHLLIESGPFPELLGLRLGIQLFGLFHVLHDKVENTYADFKFENLWWEEHRRRLRVTDWNVLGDPKERDENIPTDLARAARALVRILTGVPVSRGQRLDLHPRWDTLSAGAQRLLLRMLDVDEARRPTTADAVRQELSRLAGYWQMAPERGLRMAEAALAGAGGSLDLDGLDDETRRAVEQTTLQAIDLLSILHARQAAAGDEETQAWPAERVHQLDELVAQAQGFAPSADKLLEGALRFLQGESADRALEQLQRANRLFPDDLRVYRWREYAEAVVAGKSGPEGIRRQWQTAIEACQGDDQQSAQKKLNALDGNLASALRHEVAVYIAFKGVDQGDDPARMLESAQRAVGALDELRKLDEAYATAVERKLGISLADRVQSCQAKCDAANRVKKEITHYKGVAGSPGKFAEGAGRIEERLRLFVDQREVLLAALELGEKCLEHEEFAFAERIFAAGAVLFHAMTQDFLLCWQVAHAAALRASEPNQESTIRAVETARRAIEETSQDLDPASKEYARLKGLLMFVAPSGPSLANRQFRQTLEIALKENSDETVAVIGDKLKASQLASALKSALQRDKLDKTSRESLIEVIHKHLGLSSAVIGLLTAQKTPVKEALATATSANASVALAQAAGLPDQIPLLRTRLLAAPEDKRKQRAGELRKLADELLGSESKTVAASSSPKVSTQEKSVAATNRSDGVAQKQGPQIQASTVEKTPSASPEASDDLLAMLTSDDPRQWETIVNTPTAQRSGWPAEVTSLANRRQTELVNHRREMEKILAGLDADPVPAKERMAKWRGSNRLTNVWDPRHGRWAPAGELWQEVERAAETAQARKWLDTALQRRSNPALGDAREAITRGLAFTKADPALLAELEQSRLAMEPVRREQPVSGGGATVGGVTQPTGPASPSHVPGSLGALLEAPLREAETLTQLHLRLAGLAQENTDHADLLPKLTSDLQVWVEEERWLANAEKQANDPRMAQGIKSHAKDAIGNLDQLVGREQGWKQYITKDTPAFANLRRRLQVLAGPPLRPA